MLNITCNCSYLFNDVYYKNLELIFDFELDMFWSLLRHAYTLIG